MSKIKLNNKCNFVFLLIGFVSILKITFVTVSFFLFTNDAIHILIVLITADTVQSDANMDGISVTVETTTCDRALKHDHIFLGIANSKCIY